MPKYFPEGSDYPPSKASSDIWNDPEGFKQAINNFQLASLELITQSKTNNIDQTISSFRSLAGTCKGCHEKFKNWFKHYLKGELGYARSSFFRK